MLILPIAKDLHKLFENRSLTAIASLCVLGGVMVVTEDLALVLVIAILRTEDSWTDRASKMLYVVFAIQSCDV